MTQSVDSDIKKLYLNIATLKKEKSVLPRPPPIIFWKPKPVFPTCKGHCFGGPVGDNDLKKV